MHAHEDNKLIITMSPAELRELADKMEQRWKEIKWGQPCFVAVLSTKPVVPLHLDQEYFHKKEKRGKS